MREEGAGGEVGGDGEGAGGAGEGGRGAWRACTSLKLTPHSKQKKTICWNLVFVSYQKNTGFKKRSVSGPQNACP